MAKTFVLTEAQLDEIAAAAFARGFDLGFEQGTDKEKMRWLHMTSKQSHERMLKDFIPTQ